MKIKTYTDYFKTDVKNAVSEITRVIIVSNESQLADKIKNVKASDIILVVIVPSADVNAMNVDDLFTMNTCLLYVLKFYTNRDKVDSDFENALEETQDIAAAIAQKMIDDVNTSEHGDCPHIMHYFEPNGMHIDPEYNYLGCNGWSLSFNLKTPGF